MVLLYNNVIAWRFAILIVQYNDSIIIRPEGLTIFLIIRIVRTIQPSLCSH